jgi:DNA-binding CsgD family transcriptional regulator
MYLPPNEFRTVALLWSGLKTKQIAKQEGIKRSAVEHRIKRAKELLGMKTTDELIEAFGAGRFSE